MLPVLIVLAALQFTPDGRLTDPALEARAVRLGNELRCLVCENATIEDSPASLAGDLRRLVREQIIAGKSDEHIRTLLVERYGDFVLLRPRMTARNVILWAGPFMILAVAGALLWWRYRQSRASRS